MSSEASSAHECSRPVFPSVVMTIRPALAIEREVADYFKGRSRLDNHFFQESRPNCSFRQCISILPGFAGGGDHSPDGGPRSWRNSYVGGQTHRVGRRKNPFSLRPCAVVPARAQRRVEGSSRKRMVRGTFVRNREYLRDLCGELPGSGHLRRMLEEA
jgi:hypothetical protein